MLGVSDRCVSTVASYIHPEFRKTAWLRRCREEVAHRNIDLDRWSPTTTSRATESRDHGPPRDRIEQRPSHPMGSDTGRQRAAPPPRRAAQPTSSRAGMTLTSTPNIHDAVCRSIAGFPAVLMPPLLPSNLVQAEWYLPRTDPLDHFILRGDDRPVQIGIGFREPRFVQLVLIADQNRAIRQGDDIEIEIVPEER